MNKQQWIFVAALALIATFARAQTVEYIHTDALGSPVAVTNASGAVIERTVYEPYGAVINRPVTNGPGYTGHVADAVTGLNYMQQRYYDPGLGRFLSNDPVTATSVGGNFNRYWYANNNPYKYVDPDGRQSCTGSIIVKKNGECANSSSRIQTTTVNPDPDKRDAMWQPMTSEVAPSSTWACAKIGACGNRGDVPLEIALLEVAVVGGVVAGGLLLSDPLIAGMFSLASAPTAISDGAPPALPAFAGKTVAVLRTSAGDVQLMSGVRGPGASVAKGTSGFDIVSRTHVEGHAAALMRGSGISQATLYINNPVICSSCVKNLPRMLPPGSQLTVVTPTGSSTFVGRNQ